MTNNNDQENNLRYRRRDIARDALRIFARIDVVAAMVERAKAELRLVADTTVPTRAAEESVRTARSQLNEAAMLARNQESQLGRLLPDLIGLDEAEQATKQVRPKVA